MIHPICTTQDGTEVYVDLIKSEAAHTIARQPQLVTLLKKALLNQRLLGPEVSLECNVGHVIGYDVIVDAPSEESVFYAQIVRDTIYTRFVKTGKPLATNYIAAVLRRVADGGYELCNIRIGRLVPPRPGSVNETSASKSFWEQHAFVHNGQVLQPRTITKTRPY